MADPEPEGDPPSESEMRPDERAVIAERRELLDDEERHVSLDSVKEYFDLD